MRRPLHGGHHVEVNLSEELMSTQEKQPPASGRDDVAETCPHCGQPLLTEHAVRHLRSTQLDAERKLDEAVRALAAELARELIAGPKPAVVDAPEPSGHTLEAEKAVELHDIRLAGRQF